MEPITSTTKLLNEYGLLAILALLLVGVVYTWRYLIHVFLNENTGLLTNGHKELVLSLQSNAESNRINADCNKENARANALHAKSHDRTSRVLIVLASKLNAKDVLQAAGEEDESDDHIRTNK